MKKQDKEEFFGDRDCSAHRKHQKKMGDGLGYKKRLFLMEQEQHAIKKEAENMVSLLEIKDRRAKTKVPYYGGNIMLKSHRK